MLLSQNPKTKNIIILSIVVAFAIQALMIIVFYGHNIPLSDDGDQIFLAYLMSTDNEISFEDFSEVHTGHVPIFMRLLTIPFLLAFSFTTIPFLYFQFFIICSAIFLTYLLIKKTNKGSLWLLIPISGLIFSPLAEKTLTWSGGGIMQTLPFMLGIAMIYLLYDKLTYTKISLGLVIAGIVMFTNTVGILFWPIMLLSFIKKENRNPKFLAIWVVGGILLSLLFVYGLNQSECDFGRCDNDMSDSFSQMFNSEKIYVYFLSLVSTIFRLKFNEFYIITGIILLSIFVTTFLYSIFNKKSTSYLIPWCQYGLMGLIFILLLSLGRFHLWSGESVQIDLYYITIINFLPISIIVLFYENLNMWKKNSTKNRKTIFNIILVVFFISLLVMFIPTYIIGWKIAEDSYNWKTTELSGCLLLPASTKHYETFEYCTEFHIPEYMMTHHTKNHQEFAPEIWNYFLKNDYNIFSNKEFNESALNDAYDFTQRWNNSSNMSAIDVEFERINFNELESYSVVPKITGPQISLEGVIRSASNVNFNDLFLFLNDQPFAKINSVVNTSESTFSWKLVFLSEYVSDGCHEFSLGLIDNSISYRSSQTLEFCK